MAACPLIHCETFIMSPYCIHLKQKIMNEEKFAIIIEKTEIKKVDFSTIKKLKKIKSAKKKNLYISDF